MTQKKQVLCDLRTLFLILNCQTPELMPYVDGVWGCELLEEPDSEGNMVISEIVYTIDNTSKTRAIFEINKGIGKLDGIEVNSKILSLTVK